MHEQGSDAQTIGTWGVAHVRHRVHKPCSLHLLTMLGVVGKNTLVISGYWPADPGAMMHERYIRFLLLESMLSREASLDRCAKRHFATDETLATIATCWAVGSKSARLLDPGDP